MHVFGISENTTKVKARYYWSWIVLSLQFSQAHNTTSVSTGKMRGMVEPILWMQEFENKG
jgi:hypothetical protein